MRVGSCFSSRSVSSIDGLRSGEPGPHETDKGRCCHGGTVPYCSFDLGYDTDSSCLCGLIEFVVDPGAKCVYGIVHVVSAC